MDSHIHGGEIRSFSRIDRSSALLPKTPSSYMPDSAPSPAPTDSPSPSALVEEADASEVLDVLQDAASRVLQRRFRVVLLVRNAYERMTTHSNVLSAVWTDLRTMMRLVLQWADRSYQRVSWAPLVLIVGALLYFVVPADIIPDALGPLGFVDDVTVITTVVGRVRNELDRFRAWEEAEALPD